VRNPPHFAASVQKSGDSKLFIHYPLEGVSEATLTAFLARFPAAPASGDKRIVTSVPDLLYVHIGLHVAPPPGRLDPRCYPLG